MDWIVEPSIRGDGDIVPVHTGPIASLSPSLMEKWIEGLLKRAGAEVYVYVLNVIVHNLHKTARGCDN